MSQKMEKLALIQNDSSYDKPTALHLLPKPIQHASMLPIINRPALQNKENHGLEPKSHARVKQSCVDMPILKNILKDEANLEKRKIKQQKEVKGFRLAKEEFGREVMAGKEILLARKEGYVRRATEENEQWKGSLQLSKQLAKGRDYLCSIRKDAEEKHEDNKSKNISRERLQAIC